MIVHFIPNPMFLCIFLCGVNETNSPKDWMATFDWGEVTCGECLKLCAEYLKPKGHLTPECPIEK